MDVHSINCLKKRLESRGTITDIAFGTATL